MADDMEGDEQMDGDMQADRAAAGMEGLSIQEEKVIESKLTGPVGFDSLPMQLTAKTLKRPFEFNIILVGASGLGKSTFVNTLFAAHLVDSKGSKAPGEEPRKTTQIEAVTHVVEENGVKLKLTVVDTPGFGDLINNDKSWESIARYIQDQYHAYNKDESATVRKRHIRDTRIHLCLYFVAPTDRGLKPLDVKALQVLGEIVNVVPVIAKSDALTPEERTAVKERIRRDIAAYGIKTYPANSKNDYDAGELGRNAEIAKLIPFAVVGSERNVVINGKAVRGRRNPWGFVSIENEQHCDFVALRDFVIKTHMFDLIEVTRLQYYEEYRTDVISAKKEKKASKKEKAGDKPEKAKSKGQ